LPGSAAGLVSAALVGDGESEVFQLGDQLAQARAKVPKQAVALVR
jgi:hypothetical protein